MISLDYKLNFQPEKADQIPQLHARVADRMYDLFTSNGGLYIKIGAHIEEAASFSDAISPLFCFQARPSLLIHPCCHDQYRTNSPACSMTHLRYPILTSCLSSNPNSVAFLQVLMASLMYSNEKRSRVPALPRSTAPSSRAASGWRSRSKSRM